MLLVVLLWVVVVSFGVEAVVGGSEKQVAVSCGLA